MEMEGEMRGVPNFGLQLFFPCMSSSPWAPDVWEWISSLPPVSKWKSDSMSICLCKSRSNQRPSLNVSISKALRNTGPDAFLSLVAQFHLAIPLWTSSAFRMRSNDGTMFHLFRDIVNGVLQYGPNRNCSFLGLSARYDGDFSDVFNLAFLTLVLLVCIYEAPGDLLRSGCLETVRLQLTSSKARATAKLLTRLLGASLEENWMGSVNLAITNCIVDFKASKDSFKVPSPLFSYALSVGGLWKVQLYCPVIAMGTESTGNSTQDERLLFSLRYQQLEGVIQLYYKVAFEESGADVVVGVDNIRCDVNPLLSDALMAERGLGSVEKHFPSRVSLHLTPVHQSNVIAISIGKSSGNPAREFGVEKTVEGGFQPQNPYLGLTVAATETTTMGMKPWKFEQSARGNTANLNWFLHDGADGREVSSSKPSKMHLLPHWPWFRDRHSSAYRPFTKEGGVVFAGDEYGEKVCWKLSRRALGKILDWEIKGCIWLTYLPNKRWGHYSETKMLEFRELVQLPLINH